MVARAIPVPRLCVVEANRCRECNGVLVVGEAVLCRECGGAPLSLAKIRLRRALVGLHLSLAAGQPQTVA